MRTKLAVKFRSLALICGFSCMAGVIFQLVNENSLSASSIIVGFPLGLAFGIMELFVFPKAHLRFRRWPFTRILLFKTFLYTTVIYIVSVLLLVLAGLYEEHHLAELPPLLLTADRFVLVGYCLVVYGLLLFFLQINHLLGRGVLWKFISGRYHQPREEERIFMFLDMKSSTSIAEKLGHVRFYNFLNDLFHEITEPVLQTRGEIYQYVGDEIVISWEVDAGARDANCLRCFFLFRERLQRHSARYLANFGVLPIFKAGFHFGKVVCAQIGDLKREIVYNGDVLNTTARIQSECNHYHRDCLVSGALMHRLPYINHFEWEWIDSVTLRGKEQEVELFTVFLKNPSEQKTTTEIDAPGANSL